MTTYRYPEIAADLRRRVRAGEWEVGQRLPGISELQDEYEVRSLNVIRRAQAVLVREGLLRTAQGRGVFVASLGVRSADELLADIEHASQQLAAALGDYIAVTARAIRVALAGADGDQDEEVG